VALFSSLGPVARRGDEMSTKNIATVLAWVGRGNGPPELEAAMSEAETVEAHRMMVVAQVESLLDVARRRAVLDPGDVIDGLERIRRILGVT
jgi:hypothetical protein